MVCDSHPSHQVAVVIAVALLVGLHFNSGLPEERGEGTKAFHPSPTSHSCSNTSIVLVEVFVVRKANWSDMKVFIKVDLLSELYQGEIEVHYPWFELWVVKYTHYGSSLHLVYVIRSQQDL